MPDPIKLDALKLALANLPPGTNEATESTLRRAEAYASYLRGETAPVGVTGGDALKEEASGEEEGASKDDTTEFGTDARVAGYELIAWHRATSTRDGFDTELYVFMRRRFDTGHFGARDFVMAGMPFWHAKAAAQEMDRQLAGATRKEQDEIREDWAKYALAFLEIAWRAPPFRL